MQSSIPTVSDIADLLGTKVCKTENPYYGPRFYFLKLLLQGPKYRLLSGLCDTIGVSEYDEVSKALLSITEATGTSLSVLRFMIAKEIMETGIKLKFGPNIAEKNSGTLFRGSTMTTNMVSLFCKEKGGIISFVVNESGFPLLEAVLLPTLQLISSEGVIIEVDPDKLSGGATELMINQQKLVNLTASLLDHIFDSVNSVPQCLRTLFYHCQAEVVKRFPGMKQMVVGGFLFLRYLCPALVTPEGYGLRVSLNGKTRRTLILISKIIQNIANGVQFEGQKEPYMMPFNSLVIQYRDVMKHFEDENSTIKTNEELKCFNGFESVGVIFNILEKVKPKLQRLLAARNMIKLYEKLNIAMELYPIHRDKLQPKQIKERENVLTVVYERLKERQIAIAEARQNQVKAIELEVSKLRDILQREQAVTRLLAEQVAAHEDSITQMAEAKFQNVYGARILEFKDTFLAIKSWKNRFNSTEELELELNRIKDSLASPTSVEPVMMDSFQQELLEKEAEIRQLEQALIVENTEESVLTKTEEDQNVLQKEYDDQVAMLLQELQQLESTADIPIAPPLPPFFQ